MVIAISWEWLGRVPKGEAPRGRVVLADFPMYRKDPWNNTQLIQFILKRFEKADLLAGHNNGRFDNKRANADIIRRKLTPPPPTKNVDTLAIVKRYFGFGRNSLKYLCEVLDLPRKLDSGGYQTWKDCLLMDSSPKCLRAWARMKRYCGGDMISWKALYLRVRPWDQRHPAMRPRDTSNNPPCPACNERRLHRRGTGVNRKGSYPRFQCKACGHWPPVAWVKKSWVIK